LIVLFCGLPGVGKTTLAEALAPLLGGAVVLSTDKIRKEIIPKPTYTTEEKSLIYNVMLLMAKYLHNAGVNCILDATFNTERSRREAIDKVGANRPQIHIVECVCPEDVTLARLKSRKESYSDADVSIYVNMKRIYEPIKEDHIVIDTSSRSPEMNAKEISSKIMNRNES
jgi:predicted kinase